MLENQSEQDKSNEEDISQQSIQASSPVKSENEDNENSVEKASSDNNSSESSDSSNFTPNNKIKLNSLTPSVYNEYNEILKNVFAGDEHKNDNNIAITADYGEGKSSVINSFLKQNQEIKEKTITVSLSKYNYKNKNDDTKKHSCKCKDNDLDGCNGDYSICEHLHSVENRIEVQIINQILYQIDSKNIYLSKYKIKKNLSNGWRRFFGILAATLIFSIYNLIFCLSENIKELSNWTDKWGLWLGWLVVIILLSIFSFFFVFYQQWQRISNIVFNVFGSKIETNYFKNNAFNLSVWDQEWREIIYIISHSQKNYIIFEDLDRLENYEILSKLKDLCSTLNNEKNQKNNENIKFIYVISDNVFKDEIDKTKFFDLIIPIVPVPSLENKLSIWKSSLSGCKYIPSDFYFKIISKFVYDIRTIKHICNEYKIYLNQLLNKKLKLLEDFDSIGLMSILLMKNFFYLEYEDLKMKYFDYFSINEKRNKNTFLDILISNFPDNAEEYVFYKYVGFDLNNYKKDDEFINLVNQENKDLEELLTYDIKSVDYVLEKLIKNKWDDKNIKVFWNYKIVFEFFSVDYYQEICDKVLKLNEDDNESNKKKWILILKKILNTNNFKNSAGFICWIFNKIDYSFIISVIDEILESNDDSQGKKNIFKWLRFLKDQNIIA